MLDGIPATLPALSRALGYQARAAAVGFDWPDVDGVVAKVREELDEVLAAPSPEAVRDEIGDLLFAVVNLARRMDVDPEAALRAATVRFGSRFRHVESAGDVAAMSLDEMDALWNQAKERE